MAIDRIFPVWLWHVRRTNSTPRTHADTSSSARQRTLWRVAWQLRNLSFAASQRHHRRAELAGGGQPCGEPSGGIDAPHYLEQSILHPDAYVVEGFASLMPKDLGKKLTTPELNDLVAFLLTLQ